MPPNTFARSSAPTLSAYEDRGSGPRLRRPAACRGVLRGRTRRGGGGHGHARRGGAVVGPLACGGRAGRVAAGDRRPPAHIHPLRRPGEGRRDRRSRPDAAHAQPGARPPAAHRGRHGARRRASGGAAGRARVDHLPGHHAGPVRAAARGVGPGGGPRLLRGLLARADRPGTHRLHAAEHAEGRGRAHRCVPPARGGAVPRGLRRDRRGLDARGGGADEAARERLPLGEHRPRERAGHPLRPHGHRRVGGNRRGRDQAVRIHVLQAGPRHGRSLSPGRPLLSRVAGARVRHADGVHRARRRGEPAHALLLRRAGRTRSQRSVEVRARLTRRDLRRLLQAGGRGPARIAGAPHHPAAPRAGRRDRLPRRLRARAPGPRAPLRMARGPRLRRDRDRPPEPRPRARGARGAGRGRLPGSDARHRGPEPRASVTTVGVVGLGYWGPNLARNFDQLPGSELAWLCDSSEEALARWGASFPSARTSAQLDDLLNDESLDAVVIATPVPTHAELALRVIEAGKHCFVEKPLARTEEEAEAVVKAADDADRVLMVGHLLEYHPGVQRLAEIVRSGELGELRYIYSNRLNLGKDRPDENALWSLGVHDLSVILMLAEEEPFAWEVMGESYLRPNVEDVVFVLMRFHTGLLAHMHLSWLDPHKERRFTVVGSKRMATFDDMELERKLTVYDKGFDQKSETYGEYITRSGDIWSPRVPNDEPLRLECEHFLACVRDGLT